MGKALKWGIGALVAVAIVRSFGNDEPAATPVSDLVPTTTATTTTATPTTSTSSPTTTATVTPTVTPTTKPVIAPVPLVKVPAPAPKPKPKPKPTTYKAPAPSPKPASVYYANCSEARAAGAAPLYVGEAGYRSALDRDHDGVACES